MNIKEKQIILIGPVCAGKTTLGKLVAEGLNKESVSLDEIAGKYYKENGFVFSEYKELDLTKYTENKTAMESRDEILALFECMMSKEERS